MKKLLSIVLAMAMVASMAVTASADDSVIEATESTATIMVGDEEAEVAGYNIAFNNYYKLRDLGVMADFDVSWDEDTQTISIDTTASYMDDEAVVEEEVAEEVTEEVVEEVAEEVAEEVTEEVVEEVVEEVAEEVTEEVVEEIVEEEVAEEVTEEVAEEVTEEVVEEVVEEEMIVSVTTSTVLVDGVAVELTAYNINYNNYFKLRDIAEAISGSEKQFDITWDEETSTIGIVMGDAYGTADAAAAEALAAEEAAAAEAAAEEAAAEEAAAAEAAAEEEEYVYDEVAVLRATIINVAAEGYDIIIEESELADFTTVEELYAYADERGIYWGEGN